MRQLWRDSVFFKHTPKLIIFGTRNLRTRTHNTESGAGCKRVCTRLLLATSVSWDSVSSTAGQVCLSLSGHHRRHNRPVASVTPSVCEGQGTPLWASSALKLALFRATLQTTTQQTVLFRATHDFQKKHALFSVCSLRDNNVITSKPTWKLKQQTLF